MEDDDDLEREDREDKVKKRKSDKKRSKRSSSETDSDDHDKKKEKKKTKKHKKHKKAKKERACEVLPSERADKLLVGLLREGVAKPEQTRQLLSMIDSRQAILTAGISDRSDRDQLEKFLSTLGLQKVKAAQGTAYQLAERTIMGIKLVRHYGLVLDKYTRNPVQRKPRSPQPTAAPPKPPTVASSPMKPPTVASSRSVLQDPSHDDESDGLGPSEPAEVLGPLDKPLDQPPIQPLQGKVVGPSIPGWLEKSTLAAIAANQQEQEAADAASGPQPAGQYSMHQLLAFETARTIEEEAAMKNDRDDWMLTLPEKRKSGAAVDPLEMALNLPREFSRKSGATEEAGSRGKWTETPADRERKRLAKLAGVEMHEPAEDTDPKHVPEDPDTTVYSRGMGNKKAKKSLLEIHQAGTKKTKKTEPAPGYQPFDRERDLKITGSNKLQDVKKLKSQFQLAFGSSGYQT
eukprot:TRINITY_DN6130_c0_g1_i4.p1 TRINITY_DN6130_c0_g1~~TRINITY_DN6130_c0_g1_i4.p1  ORF type:complete len:461 (-),score=91.26 TRINITY_DN6130_c0_g1_i4:13-1395(-)